MLRIREIVEFFHEWAPPYLAEDWDTVGLQVGDPEQRTDRVLVALDPSVEAVRAADSLGAGLLITHHPLFFHPLRSLLSGDPVTGIVQEAFHAGVAIFCAHTNLDGTWGGVSDVLARTLGIEVVDVLEESPQERVAKLVLFVPPDSVEAVREAVFQAGGGVIGAYSCCSFQVSGTGTFLPGEEASPYRGVQGEMERVSEARLEVLVPRDRIAGIVERVRKVHPYEEPAYDVVPLLNPTHRGGMGRVGRLPEPLRGWELADLTKRRLGLDALRMAGDPEKTVRTVALCGGAGASLYPQALRKGADAFITGEFTYHQALDASAAGLLLVDPGHFASERPVLDVLAEKLEKRFGTEYPGFRAVVFQEERDVFTMYRGKF